MDGRARRGRLPQAAPAPARPRPAAPPAGVPAGVGYDSAGMTSGADRASFVTRAKIAGLPNGDAGQVGKRGAGR